MLRWPSEVTPRRESAAGRSQKLLSSDRSSFVVGRSSGIILTTLLEVTIGKLMFVSSHLVW